jgi:hypothetical protein
MKRSLVAITCSLIALAGCGQKNQTSATASTNAPADGYLGTIAKAKKSAEKTVDTVSVNKAIQMFSASEGRYPKDLNELVTGKYLVRIPEAPYGMKIVYDAAKGEVSVVPQ